MVLYKSEKYAIERDTYMIKKTGVLVVSIIGIILALRLNVNSGISAQGNTMDDKNQNIESNNSEYGRKRLVELENLNVDEVEDKIKDAKVTAEAKELLKENGQVDLKKYYKNTVFFGDSLTEFISAAQILTEKSVVATKGRNVITAKQDIEKIKALNPERIIILFGMNDVEVFSNTEDFKNKYVELINEIKAVLPKTDIYIESPLPVQAKAANASPRLTNDNVAKFRQACKEVAETEGAKYVDISVLVKDEKYFEPDGIHFVYDFYPGLLNFLRNTIEMNKVK